MTPAELEALRDEEWASLQTEWEAQRICVWCGISPSESQGRRIIRMTNMTDRGFSRYEGKSGGHWTFEPRLIEQRADADGELLPLPRFRQVQLGIAVAARARRCRHLANRRHCSPARREKLLRRAWQADRELRT